MIPEPLSAVAAEMVTTHDQLLREREEFIDMRARAYVRWQRVFYIQIATITAALVSCAAVWFMR